MPSHSTLADHPTYQLAKTYGLATYEFDVSGKEALERAGDVGQSSVAAITHTLCPKA